MPLPDAGVVAIDAATDLYPPGPYGLHEGDVIKPLNWDGWVDSAADPDDDPFNETPTTVLTEAYFQGSDPGARMILINASSGTCSNCQAEMPVVQSLFEEYRSRGVRMITALRADGQDAPADTAFAKEWGQTYGLTFATVADPTDKLKPFYESDAMPMNMYIDASTMTIVEVRHGFDEAYTRQLFDAYVD